MGNTMVISRRKDWRLVYALSFEWNECCKVIHETWCSHPDRKLGQVSVGSKSWGEALTPQSYCRGIAAWQRIGKGHKMLATSSNRAATTGPAFCKTLASQSVDEWCSLMHIAMRKMKPATRFSSISKMCNPPTTRIIFWSKNASKNHFSCCTPMPILDFLMPIWLVWIYHPHTLKCTHTLPRQRNLEVPKFRRWAVSLKQTYFLPLTSSYFFFHLGLQLPETHFSKCIDCLQALLP